MKRIATENIVEETAVANMACFIIWNIGLLCHNTILDNIAITGVIVTLLINICGLCMLKSISDQQTRLRILRRRINRIIFSACFITATLVIAHMA